MGTKMLKKVFVASLFAACFFSCNNTPKEVKSVTSTRVISLSDSILSAPQPDTIDLGSVTAGEVIRHELTLQNSTSSPLIILSVASSCGCTKVDFPKKPILPGSDAPFAFEFDSNGFSGYQLKRITLQTSASSRAYVLIVTAEVH